jgi:hypothetical protein
MAAWFPRLFASTRPAESDAPAEGKSGHRSLLLNDVMRRFVPNDDNIKAGSGTRSSALLDMLVFCTLALALGAWLWPDDAFGVHADFPWLWIVPALLAMRHGSSIAVGAVLLYVAAWLLAGRFEFGGVGGIEEFPKGFFLGGIALIMLCGQFSDLWHARSRRLNAINDYLEERLQTLTKSHFLLRLSHERLEQDLLVKPVTLRETLVRLRALGVASPARAGTLPGAAEFMQLLGQSCQLEIAALYALDADGKLLPTPLASIGAFTPLATDDALVRYSLAENLLSHVQTDDVPIEERSASRYLVAAPLLPSAGAAIGLLVVEKMPFLALNHETLQLLSVLTDYYADGVNLDNATRKVLAKVPDCPPYLALDVVRLHRVRLQGGIDSSMVALVFDTDDTSLDMFEAMKRIRRGVDIGWELRGAQRNVLLTLLPLAGSAAVEGYLLRAEDAMKAQFGSGFLASGVAIHTARLGFSPPAATLAHLVARCGL